MSPRHVALALLGACGPTPCDKAAAHYADLYGADLATLGVAANDIARFRTSFERDRCALDRSDRACIATAQTLDDANACVDRLDKGGDAWRRRVDLARYSVGTAHGRVAQLDKAVEHLVALGDIAVPAGLPERCPERIADIVYVDTDLLAALAVRRAASDAAMWLGSREVTPLADYAADKLDSLEPRIELRAWAHRTAAPSVGIGVIRHTQARPPLLVDNTYNIGEFDGEVVVFDAGDRPVCRVAVTERSPAEMMYTYHLGAQHEGGQGALDRDWDARLHAMLNRAHQRLTGKPR